MIIFEVEMEFKLFGFRMNLFLHNCLLLLTMLKICVNLLILE